MKSETLNIEITLTEDLLGSSPGNPETLEEFVAAKAPTVEDAAEEMDAAAIADEVRKRSTVFARDERGVFLWDYQIRGFLKEGVGLLIELGEITGLTKWAHKKAVDSLVFVTPRRLYITNGNSQPLSGDLTCLSRPLRAETMRGERIALARSELVPAGSKLRCKITVLTGSNSKSKLAVLKLDDIRKVLDYGKFKGLGQWRGGGYGRLEWREVK